MRALADAFLEVPIGGRAAIFIGIIVLLWCVFGKLILKLASILPWGFKKIFIWIYMLLEMPIGALHSKFGGIFGGIDQGLANISESVCAFMDKLLRKMNRPQTIYRARFLVAYLLLLAYLIIPMCANLTEKPFTFWQKSYIKSETKAVEWMNDNGWLEVGREWDVAGT